MATITLKAAQLTNFLETLKAQQELDPTVSNVLVIEIVATCTEPTESDAVQVYALSTLNPYKRHYLGTNGKNS